MIVGVQKTGITGDFGDNIGLYHGLCTQRDEAYRPIGKRISGCVRAIGIRHARLHRVPTAFADEGDKRAGHLENTA